jgi:hypothetical protein
MTGRETSNRPAVSTLARIDALTSLLHICLPWHMSMARTNDVTFLQGLFLGSFGFHQKGR